jgi:ADP-ribose pyrophosphatase
MRRDPEQARPRRASRRVYTGRVVSLDIDTVSYPDGSEGVLEMVRHPGAAAIVPFMSDPTDADPQILLLKQYRYAAEQVLYEIPAGRIQDGEEPVDCARRELLEETGCVAGKFVSLFSFFTTPGFTDEHITTFVATGLTRGETSHETDEFIEVVVKPMSELLEMIRHGAIPDGKTALSLLFVAGFYLGN